MLSACVRDAAAEAVNKVFKMHTCDVRTKVDSETQNETDTKGDASRKAISMLAFDIETEGLDSSTHGITCACAYDPDTGVERTFIFPRGDSREEFMLLLDEASSLCAFNGARFDIPFMARSWGVNITRVARWMLKLVDVYEATRLCIGRGFSLNALLAANGLEGKTGSGLEAVAMAKEGRWDELGAYCMHDTRMTHIVTCMPEIRLPIGRRGAQTGRLFRSPLRVCPY